MSRKLRVCLQFVYGWGRENAKGKMQNAKSKNEERGEGHTTVGTGVLDRPKMKWGKEKERPERLLLIRML